MGYNTHTLCFSPNPLSLLHSSSSSKGNTFFKRSFLPCCIKSRVDRWYRNPRRKPTLDDQNQNRSRIEIVRDWVESNSALPSTSKERFTVVSYNILGDRNASKHRDLYSFVPSEYLKWDRRKTLICEELVGLDSDIICLQEVDKYYELLKIMEKEGYVGSYKRRTGWTADGCAMLWKADKFRLLEGESIEFKEFGLRDNVAQIFVFEMCNADSRRVVVGNIHVLFNPNRGDIKLSQIHMLLSRAHTLSEKWGHVPVVLAGDFNSTPQSPIYQFLSSSQLDVTLYDKRYLSGQQSSHPSQSGGFQGHVNKASTLVDRFVYCWTEEKVTTAAGNTNGTTVEHPLKLKSSYASIMGSVKTRDSYGEPLATSFHSKFLGTVDYLWYSDGLVPTRVLNTPAIDILRETRGLPHGVWSFPKSTILLLYSVLGDVASSYWSNKGTQGSCSPKC